VLADEAAEQAAEEGVTGADKSRLGPLNGEELGLDYSQLTERPAVGTAGATGRHVEPAMLLSFEPGVGLHTYWLDLLIVDRGDSIEDFEQVEPVPSVLGRDVLDYWLMVYSRMGGLLEFDVRYADATNPPTSH
jgi:hypothetical protein